MANGRFELSGGEGFDCWESALKEDVEEAVPAASSFLFLNGFIPTRDFGGSGGFGYDATSLMSSSSSSASSLLSLPFTNVFGAPLRSTKLSTDRPSASSLTRSIVAFGYLKIAQDTLQFYLAVILRIQLERRCNKMMRISKY